MTEKPQTSAAGGWQLPASCALCPRRCGADRAAGQRGACGADDTLVVARAALHFWEEPPISGVSGSGTVFFSNCSLGCVYCQNRAIAAGQAGKAITVERLAQIFLEQQARGANNLNLVTATHYLPQVKAALDLARDQGLALPVVYNTSGYETVEAVRSLDGYVDVWLTDFKYASSGPARRYSHAPDYPQVAAAALEQMVAQTEAQGGWELGGLDRGSAEHPLPEGEDPIPLLTRGVVVRHLMLPGGLADSKAVVARVLERYGDAVCLSLMNQYTPMPQVIGTKLARRLPELARTVTEDEYSELIDYALDLGATNSFMQEGGAVGESFIPDFDCQGV